MFLVHPYDIVNFQELGENHIGVIVEDSVSDSVKSSNNMLSISVPTLQTWPLHLVTFEDGSTLQPLVYEACTNTMLGDCGKQDGSSSASMNVEPLLKKRKYQMVNRKPRKETQCMMNKKCTFGNVQQLALIDCCKLKCCQTAERTTILELRMEFWNMTLENRMAYIFNAFGNSIRTNTNGVVSYLFGFCGKDNMLPGMV